MANTENLMPIQEVNSRRTREQHSEDSRKAGKASGAARRRKRDMAETIKYLMDLPVQSSQKKLKEAMSRAGIPDNEQTQRTAAVFNMMLEISKGNVQAFRAITEVERTTTDAKLRRQQFNYQKQHDKDVQEMESHSASSLADIIENAYRNREAPDKPAADQSGQTDQPGQTDQTGQEAQESGGQEDDSQ